MQILGIDYGQKRIGLATGNDEARIAKPLKVLPNNRDFMAHLHELITEEGIEDVVVGLPRGLDGQETTQTRIVRDFVEELSQSVNVTFHLQDEALTTKHALERLRQVKRHKHELDAEAAAIILQDYLDNL